MANGEFHSGESLGKELGVSRAAVWKTVQGIQEIGVDIERVRGLGYRIEGGLSLLDEKLIRQYSHLQHRELFDEVIITPVIHSTNKFLLEKIAANEDVATRAVCIAEMQTAGRGRRGRQWQSPFARNIYISFSWQFNGGVLAVEGLSLAVAVAVAESIEELGFPAVRLKWPNDILFNSAKLGGILIEIAGDASGHCHAVVGVGLNIATPGKLMKQIDQSWTDLASLSHGKVPQRNQVVGVMMKHMGYLLSEFEEKGFAHYRQRWEALNAHDGHRVVLTTPSQSIEGAMLGVSDSGALRLLVDGRERQFVGGEISLRARQ